MLIIVAHVAIALFSLATAGVAYLRPSRAKLRVSYVLVGATLGTGSILVLQRQAHLASACISGLAYLAAVSAMLALSRNKLANSRI